MDYHRLLAKYMAEVIADEGVDFLFQPHWTPEEWEALHAKPLQDLVEAFIDETRKKYETKPKIDA